MESIKYKGLTIEIKQDEGFDQSPDDDHDDGLFLIANHRDFTIKREGFADSEDQLKETGKQYHIFGLEAYIHSGVKLALSNTGNFPDRQWDVSQLGFVFVKKSEFRQKAEARKVAQGLIEVWNNYLEGNIWEYVVKNNDGEMLDGCGAYVGDPDKTGILEDAKAAADSWLSNNPVKTWEVGLVDDEMIDADDNVATYKIKARTGSEAIAKIKAKIGYKAEEL